MRTLIWGAQAASLQFSAACRKPSVVRSPSIRNDASRRDQLGADRVQAGSLRSPASADCLRILEHFLDGRIAGEDTAQPVLAQRDHAELDRFLFKNDRWCALVDQFANRIGNPH
jgi:hypothetical protein